MSIASKAVSIKLPRNSILLGHKLR